MRYCSPRESSFIQDPNPRNSGKVNLLLHDLRHLHDTQSNSKRPKMTPFNLLWVFTITYFIMIRKSSASNEVGAQRIPLGGSLFQLEPRGLESRDDKGSDCGLDPDCTLVDWGCQCGFTDGSWMDPPPAPSSSAPPPPSSTGPASPSFPSCTTL